MIKASEIPTKGALHDLRADYAADLYHYYESAGLSKDKEYYCRKELAGIHYNKHLLELVSRDLSHERTNVVINYLWKLQ